MRRLSLLAGSLCLLVLSTLVTADPTSKPKLAPEILPGSLDALYPPRASAPLFLQGMHQLNAALTAIAVDLFEDDHQAVVQNFERFRSQYRESAHLVPEWEAWYPDEPVAELGAAVENGTPDQVMAAIQTVGAVCHSCHVATMVSVQQRYYWPDFTAIAVTDPVRRVDLPYPAFMQALNVSMTGIQVDLAQGETEMARKHLEDLVARMGALKESCEVCHDTERAYYTDSRTDLVLSRMGEALAAPGFDPEAVARLGQELGQKSCSGCHLVHLPAAYARFREH